MPYFSRALCWFRRDLRLSDHVALAHATAESEQVACVFVFDTTILDELKDRDDRRVWFIFESLRELDQRLRESGSRLIVLHGDPVQEIPKLAWTLGAEAVYANDDVEPSAEERDRDVRERLERDGRKLLLSRDHVIFIRDQVLKPDGEPFRVYTPYSKAWKAKLTSVDLEEHIPDPSKYWKADALHADCPAMPASITDIGFQPTTLWLEPGENGAAKRLAEFSRKIGQYDEQRDLIDGETTSGLSVHLRHGTISIRECARFARHQSSKGAEKWLNELIWRDFYSMILALYPDVVDQAFNPEYDDLEWPGTQQDFERWCEGQTGYPLVDAGMRCLRETGWMHNRLRMVTAMFLTKDLLVDWRWGEAHFARYLLDFDLASNNGGWQWSASTGADPQPYFRIFNPILQSKKFDAAGAFIRTWVPELKELADEAIHAPWEVGALELAAAGVELGRTYPAPMVDHHRQREQALALFQRQK